MPCSLEHRERVKMDTPEIKFGDITKQRAVLFSFRIFACSISRCCAVATEWKELSKAEKEPYEKKAKEDKKRSVSVVCRGSPVNTICSDRRYDEEVAKYAATVNSKEKESTHKVWFASFDMVFMLCVFLHH